MMNFWLTSFLKLLLGGMVLFTMHGQAWLLFLFVIMDDLNSVKEGSSYVVILASVCFFFFVVLYLKELFLGYRYKSKQKTIKSLFLLSALTFLYFIGHSGLISRAIDKEGIEMNIILVFTILIPLALLVHRVVALKENI